MDLTYQVVDVFTQVPLEGNPLAVFPDARGLNEDQMQRIAREMNLSETAFVLPSDRNDCVANVRIFTPQIEMRFAGHPTIGTAFVLWNAGHSGTETRAFAFEERVGRVPIRIDDGAGPLIWLRTPPIDTLGEVPAKAAALSVGLTESDLLDGVPSQVLTAGNPTMFVPLRDKAAVDRAWADDASRRHLDVPGGTFSIFAFTPTPDGAYSRMFGHSGVIEDPATGSSTGPLALYMMSHGLAPSHDGARFISEQGTKMGRRSLLHLRIRGDRGSEAIEVGGHVRPLVHARMTL